MVREVQRQRHDECVAHVAQVAQFHRNPQEFHNFPQFYADIQTVPFGHNIKLMGASQLAEIAEKVIPGSNSCQQGHRSAKHKDFYGSFRSPSRCEVLLD